MTNQPKTTERCGCGVELEPEEGHEVGGMLLCFDCYEWAADEALFGYPDDDWD